MNPIQNERRGQTHVAPKKSYEKPMVTTFGSVAKLTNPIKPSLGGDGASHKGKGA
jgi:hypothetical protein